MERTSCLGVGGTEKGGALDLWFCSKTKVAGRSRFRDHVGVEDMQGGCGGCSLAYSLCCEVVCKQSSTADYYYMQHDWLHPDVACLPESWLMRHKLAHLRDV